MKLNTITLISTLTLLSIPAHSMVTQFPQATNIHQQAIEQEKESKPFTKARSLKNPKLMYTPRSCSRSKNKPATQQTFATQLDRELCDTKKDEAAQKAEALITITVAAAPEKALTQEQKNIAMRKQKSFLCSLCCGKQNNSESHLNRQTH